MSHAGPNGGPRVGVLGARRARQGLGPFVVRDLLAAGARVPCVLTSRIETLEATQRELLDHHGLEARGYLDTREMLEQESLDALVILSPAGTHAPHLRTGLEAFLHVLCEKPFMWGDPAGGMAREAHEIVGAFAERGLILRENCQWPETLPAFFELFPDAPASRGARPETFAMRLAPASSGRDLIGDALPHALSLLQALAPGEEVRLSNILCSNFASEARAVTLDFRYHADAHTVQARVELVATDSQPREAAYSVDGFRARREVRMEDYALSLVDEDGGRSVPLPDPLGQLVARFVADLAQAVTGKPNVVEGVPAREPVREIWQRMACLEELARVFDAG